MTRTAATLLMIVSLVLPLWLDGQAVRAAVHKVEKEEGGGLAAALKSAKPGDTILLGPGVFRGNFLIEKPINLIGKPGAILDAEGEGSVIRVDAADVTISGLTIRGSGADHEKSDSGVFLGKKAHRAQVLDNHITGNLIGVYVWGQKDAVVRGNVIVGRRDHHMNSRGNGVYVWNAPGAKVLHNDIRYGRDGIFVNASKKNKFIGNRMRDLRFAVHYMYTHNSEVSGNESHNNHAGYALMFSDRLTVRKNLAVDSLRHGILLNYANKSTFEGNKVVRGGERCVFIYNSNRNRFSGNWFEQCDVGIHFTGGSERNSVNANTFLKNQRQVKYVGTKWVEWSTEGKGNYWSDHTGFDVNGDGIADTAYKPNDLVDQILWRHPTAKSLLQSPAFGVLRWAQRQFPALYPGGVIDRHPLMAPVIPDLPGNWPAPGTSQQAKHENNKEAK